MSKTLTSKANSLCWFSVWLHVVWVIIFGFLVWAGPFGRPEAPLDIISKLLNGCDICENASDSIYTAAQMGRLDFLSLSLTVLAAALGVGAIGAFLFSRKAAIEAAEEQAVEYLQDNLSRLIEHEDLQKALLDNPRLLLTLARLVEQELRSDESDSMSDADADKIANTYSTGEADE